MSRDEIFNGSAAFKRGIKSLKLIIIIIIITIIHVYVQ